MYGNELCRRVHVCPEEIPNGQLSEECRADVDLSCEYTCSSGYQRRTNYIFCRTPTNVHTLCTNDKQCSWDITGGRLHSNCERNPGDSCSFTCYDGYEHSSSYKLLSCGSSAKWIQPIDSVCIPITCPTSILDGIIPSSCSRIYRTTCEAYQCDPGHEKPPLPPTLTCSKSGNWEWDTKMGLPCPKEGTTCPAAFKNGAISSDCTRQYGAVCTFTCDPGCDRSWLAGRLICGRDGKWMQNMDSICTNCRLCPTTIPNGNISLSCERLPSETCDFTCHQGCRSTRNAIYCDSERYWYNENTACDCSDESSSAGSSSIGMVLAIIGGIGAVLVVGICIWSRKKKKLEASDGIEHSEPMIYTSGEARPVVLPSAPPLLTDTNREFDLPPRFRALSIEDSSNNYTSHDHITRPVELNPPAYGTGLISQPVIPPPSYEEVISDPAKYKG